MSTSKTADDRLCDSVTAVIGLMNIHRGDALLRVEEGFVGGEACLDGTWLKSQLSRVKEGERYDQIIACVQKALAAVVIDFEARADLGEERAGDDLATTLSEETYTVQTLRALRAWVTEEEKNQRLTGEKLEENALKKIDMHTPIEACEYERRRTVVEQTKEWLKVRHGTRVDLCEVARVVSDTDSESDATNALALQACMEAGFKTESDKWLRSTAELINPNAMGAVNVPAPTPRSMKMALLHATHFGPEGFERGLPTGDVWMGKPAAECVGMGTYYAYGSIKKGLKPPVEVVFSRWHPRAVLSQLDSSLARALRGIEEGRNDGISLLYETFVDHAMVGVEPTGRTNAVAWRTALNNMDREEGTLAGVLNTMVGFRAVVAIYAGAADYNSFCRGLVDRVLGSTAAAGLELSNNGHTATVVYEHGVPGVRGALPEDIGDDLRWVIGILRSIDAERGLVSAFDDRWADGNVARQTEHGYVGSSSIGTVAHALWKAEGDSAVKERRPDAESSQTGE